MYVLGLCKRSAYWAIIINELLSPLWCVGSSAFSIKYIRVKTGCL